MTSGCNFRDFGHSENGFAGLAKLRVGEFSTYLKEDRESRCGEINTSLWKFRVLNPNIYRRTLKAGTKNVSHPEHERAASFFCFRFKEGRFDVPPPHAWRYQTSRLSRASKDRRHSLCRYRDLWRIAQELESGKMSVFSPSPSPANVALEFGLDSFENKFRRSIEREQKKSLPTMNAFSMDWNHEWGGGKEKNSIFKRNIRNYRKSFSQRLEGGGHHQCKRTR